MATAGVLSFEDFRRQTLAARHDSYRRRSHAKVQNRAAFRDMQDHVARFYEGVQAQHSFVDENGQIFDCIPYEQQPALKNAAPPPPPPPPVGEHPAASPSATPLQAGRQDRFGNNIACPPGTVPVRRLTLGELTCYPTLRQFLSKRRHRVDVPAPVAVAAALPPPEAPGDGTHMWAHALQEVPNVGGHSILNVWSPQVTDDQDFSLAQHWYIADGPQGRQTVEIGWHVWAPKFGHGSLPRLFTYWTADGYATTGSYNTDGGEFIVAANPPLAPGASLPRSSVVDGAQVELEIIAALNGAFWWVYVGFGGAPQALGCYPTSIYNNGPMTTGARIVDYGGETDGITSHPAMGSGQFADTGAEQAAYHRNIYYLASGTTAPQTAQLQVVASSPSLYTAALGGPPNWATCLFFGGPGDVESA